MRDTGILGKILCFFNTQKCPTPPKNDDAKANYLYFQAMVNSAINGREIDNND
jgi:hypothetical protein